MWIFLHRTTNSRKPMVKIRFAFALSCEESQNCHWTQCVSTTSISKKQYYFCSPTLVSLNTNSWPLFIYTEMFIVAWLTQRLLRWGFLSQMIMFGIRHLKQQTSPAWRRQPETWEIFRDVIAHVQNVVTWGCPEVENVRTWRFTSRRKPEYFMFLFWSF